MIQMIYQLDRSCRQLGFLSRYPLFQSARERHIVGGMAGADADLVLSEGHVQDPGERISAGLAAVHDLQQGPRLRRPAGDAVMGPDPPACAVIPTCPSGPPNSPRLVRPRPGMWARARCGVVSPATNPLPSPLVVLHGSGDVHSRMLLTDTPPEWMDATLYACRDWIEQNFRGPARRLAVAAHAFAPARCGQGGTGW